MYPACGAAVMLTWTDSYQKMQRLAKDSNADVLIQLKQDYNTGYHLFNQKLARYYYRKQQFANSKASQSIYQAPIDSVRVMGMTYLVSSGFEPPLTEVIDEQEWRMITAVKNYANNWPTWYKNLGHNLFQIWPTPSQAVTNGIRYWYQMQDHDLSIDDTLSFVLGVTVTVANGSPTVTADAGATPFTADMAGLSFQVTGQADLTWYAIASATTTTLTLQQSYIGVSSSGKSWRIGQTSIIPQEYQDAPLHYALGNFFSGNSNEARAQYHLGTPDKPGMFWSLVDQCREDYSTSSMSSTYAEEDYIFNPWFITPPAATGS